MLGPKNRKGIIMAYGLVSKSYLTWLNYKQHISKSRESHDVVFVESRIIEKAFVEVMSQRTNILQGNNTQFKSLVITKIIDRIYTRQGSSETYMKHKTRGSYKPANKAMEDK